MAISFPLLVVTIGLIVAFLLLISGIVLLIKRGRTQLSERNISDQEVMAEMTKAQFHTRRPF